MNRAAASEWVVEGGAFLGMLYWMLGLGASMTVVAAVTFIALETPAWYEWLMILPPAAALGVALKMARLAQRKRRQWEEGRTIETVRGEKVRSRPEARIANWLHVRGYKYQYEPEICGYRPDFLIPELNVIIEYWGSTDASYAETRAKKVKAYQEAGFGVISSEGWEGLEAELERKLYRFDKNVYNRASPNPLPHQESSKP